jgi:hypothetical protein
MNNSIHKLSWIDQAIYAWTQSGTKLQPGLSRDEILEFEALLNFKFPKDFIDLYQKVNGFSDLDWNEHMFSFWSLERIVDEYKSDNDNDFIGFCDFLINSYSIGFSKEDNRIFKSFDRLEPVSATFEEAVMLINSSSGNIY